MKKIIISILLFSMALSAGIAPVLAQDLKSRDQKAISRYNTAKQQYQKEVQFYKSARQDFLKARNKFRKTRRAEDREVSEEKAKNFVRHVIQSLIKRLEQIRNWVEHRKTLDESEKAGIMAEIDEDITWLNGKLENIDGMTADELKQLANDIREYWKDHRVKIKRVAGEINAARFHFLITKADKLGDRVGVKIEEFKAEGKDTAQLEQWLGEYNDMVATAKEKWEAAKAKYQEINNIAEADRLAREARAFLKEAHQKIKEAHQKLVQIVREMKSMR